uniref:Peptidase M12B domain-containing protein n=2 Tax=Clastoptera arizonana TaxID=38151 RepID=A0A1B6E382_9HEMI
MPFLLYTILYLSNIVVGITNEFKPDYITGFYTEGIKNAEVIVPKKVTKNGEFVSNNLQTYYDLMSRPKRDASTAIHFSLPINGKKQYLEIWPNYKFISPNLVIEKRKANAIDNIRAADFKKMSRNQCHYSGQVIGEPKSRVALSTCNGLVGYIKMPDEEYLIEPVKYSIRTHGNEQPHVIYKRSDQGSRSKSNCGTDGTRKEAFEERMEWESLNEIDNINKEEIFPFKNELTNLKLKLSNKNKNNNLNTYNNDKITNSMKNASHYDSSLGISKYKTILPNEKNIQKRSKYCKNKGNIEVLNTDTNNQEIKHSCEMEKKDEHSFKEKQNIKKLKLDSYDTKSIEKDQLLNKDILIKEGEKENIYKSEQKTINKRFAYGDLNVKNSSHVKRNTDEMMENFPEKSDNSFNQNVDEKDPKIPHDGFLVKDNNDTCDTEFTTEKMTCSEYYAKEFNIELMITVDEKVLEMHAEGDIEVFISTIVNMVASNFYDASIGININVELVRVIYLTTCIKQLDSDIYSPTELLENFCSWQAAINPSQDSHPNHHDMAILITRLEQCEGQVLGVAYMASMCRPDKSCIICVDEGLLLANILTHQLGHSLGAEHDEGQNNGCPDLEPDGTSYHMGPTIRQSSSEWSVCSREAIIQFVRTHASSCLLDRPTTHDFDFPLMLPGQIYSAAQQCKLNFHLMATPCEVGLFCEKLFCQVSPTECVTKGDPPADGTFCATDMWCFKQNCVSIGRRPGVINGEWGKWSEWSQCTRTCGGGVESSFRVCNNPKPSKGGRYCIGKRMRHRMCFTNPCQGFTQSFRDLQCKKTEIQPFRGQYHNWQQYHNFFHNIECSLVCQNRKGQVVIRSPITVDGTPCKAGTRNVCIQGKCVSVGCDWVVESNAKEDSCGVCHGNGTGCRIIQGLFNEPSKNKTIVPFLHIPKDSGMIFIREVSPSLNLIAVSGAINKIFYLNGLGSRDDAMPGDVVFGLTHGSYEIRSNMERIFIRGPTTEALIFHAIFNEANKGIRYQYAIREGDSSYMPRYEWQFVDWDACTAPCSGGAQRARAKCVEGRGGVVDDTYCISNTRPVDVVRPCNNSPCRPIWWVSIWSECICTSSGSKMFRSVLCMRSIDEDATRAEITKESECSDRIKPVSQRSCNDTESNTKCNKRSLTYDTPCGNSSLSITRPFRSINPKLYATNQKLSRNTSKARPIQETATESLQTAKLLKNRLPLKSKFIDPSIFSLVNDMQSKPSKKIKASQRFHKKINSDDISHPKEIASAGGTCATAPPTTPSTTTCKVTDSPIPHEKTTCCKKIPTIPSRKPEKEVITEPIFSKVDELNVNKFGVTVVPIEATSRKIPETDSEFINFGDNALYNVGSPCNGSQVIGQEAIDKLDTVKHNSTEPPLILHEEINKKIHEDEHESNTE